LGEKFFAATGKQYTQKQLKNHCDNLKILYNFWKSLWTNTGLGTIAHFGWYRETTQNVLAVCDFDMRLTFVVARWLGLVHDTRVFNETLDKYAVKFAFPLEGKKYQLQLHCIGITLLIPFVIYV
jgi:hypothetical protein